MDGVDAELMLECLIYLNMFHFAIVATCDVIMTVAKYFSIIQTPKIGQDAAIVFFRLTCELVKIVVYRCFKEKKKILVTSFAVLLTVGTIFSLAYTFFIQCPVLKLEYILNSLTVMLTLTEVFFGVLQLGTKCFKKNPYY